MLDRRIERGTVRPTGEGFLPFVTSNTMDD